MTEQNFSLPTLKLSVKVLFTGYLLVMGVGILMAVGQILLTHGMADGKFGISVDDIVYSYHGNRNSSKLEVKLNGSMKDKANEVDRYSIDQMGERRCEERGVGESATDLLA